MAKVTTLNTLNPKRGCRACGTASCSYPVRRRGASHVGPGELPQMRPRSSQRRDRALAANAAHPSSRVTERLAHAVCGTHNSKLSMSTPTITSNKQYRVVRRRSRWGQTATAHAGTPQRTRRVSSLSLARCQIIDRSPWQEKQIDLLN